MVKPAAEGASRADPKRSVCGFPSSGPTQNGPARNKGGNAMTGSDQALRRSCRKQCRRAYRQHGRAGGFSPSFWCFVVINLIDRDAIDQ